MEQAEIENRVEAEKELKKLRDEYREKQSKETFAALFTHLMFTHYLYVPVELEMSETDTKNFKDASLGEIVKTTEPLSVKPVLLKSEEGSFLPVFSGIDEAAEKYADKVSWLSVNLRDCMRLKRKGLKGIVIDAFTKPVQLDGVELEMIERMAVTGAQMDEE